MTLRFGPFALDLDTRQLTRGRHDVHLSPKAFQLLSALILERPRVLSTDVLQRRLWPGTFVATANLSNLIAEIRKAVDDRPRKAAFIRTVHGFGYAFCGAAGAIPAGADGTLEQQPSCWIEWRRRRFPLSTGEHVIGRAPDVELTLDASTVSRRHARLVVTPAGTTLEDCGSKNGTFCDTARVTAPIQLTDGAHIRVGSQVVTFHVRAPGSTETLVPSPC